MTIFAYLRVSTNEQDTENQKFGIQEYAQKKGFKDIKFIADSVSGKVWWNERKLGDIVKNAKKGDVIIFAEISRIARNTLQVLEVIKECSTKEVELHIVKSNMIIDNSIQSKTLVVIYGLVAEMERDFISSRTKEALAKRKAEGMILGRPKGSENKILKLDEHKERVMNLVQNKVSITDISKIIEVSRATLYEWLRRNGVGIKKQKIKKL
jgi:DNA invertase Pin-like site-specific DNA recombinase